MHWRKQAYQHSDSEDDEKRQAHPGTVALSKQVKSSFTGGGISIVNQVTAIFALAWHPGRGVAVT
jgi:hypothetical protein